METSNDTVSSIINTGSSVEKPGTLKGDVWTILLIITLDTLVTLFLIGFFASCIIYFYIKRGKNKEERDKIGELVKFNYWEHEEIISELLDLLGKLRHIPLFREVSAAHVLAYQYRTDTGVFVSRVSEGHLIGERYPTEQYAKSIDNVLKAVKAIERLFEILILELPCKGRCPSNSAAAFGFTLHNLANATSILWSDRQFRMIRKLVHYFCGKDSLDSFDSNFLPDDELETLVLARIPYVNQLFLNGDHFVLKDVDITNDLKIDLRNKIRNMDTVMAKNPKALQHKEKYLIDSYNVARDLCLRNNFILSKTHLPDLVLKAGEPSKITECVSLLLHLLRITCMPKNLRKLETDDKYFQFLMQLHEILYTWTDASAMIEVIERTRNNIFSYLRGLSPEQMLIDKEFTKAKLEHLEKELYRHLNYLTLRQVQESKERRTQFRLQRAEATVIDPKIRSFDSESSVYTMAMSASSFVMPRGGDHGQEPIPGPSTQRHELVAPQRSIDPSSLEQVSILSGSSLYATAASLSSGPNESTPLMGPSPPIPSSPQHLQQRVDRAQSPISSSDSEFYETAV